MAVVILDRDLAAIYSVSTGRLNEAIKRNAERFPEDFMFQLNRQEIERLRSQIAILKSGRGTHVKYLPHASPNTARSKPPMSCIRRVP